jgi:hypothetical protein
MSASVFGKVALGYIVIETEKFSDWRRFGRDAIGMHVDDLAPDAMRFRLDDNECRFLLRHGPAEDVTTLGWHLDDHEAFDTVLARIRNHGVPVAEGSDEEAARNGWPDSPAPTASRRRSSPAPGPARRRCAWRPAAGSSPARRAWATSPSAPPSPIRCAATTTRCWTPG